VRAFNHQPEHGIMRQKKIRPTFDQAQRVMEMWSGGGGQDTAAIATKLDLPEPVIAGVVTTARDLAFALRADPQFRAAA
jgi:hypothetical protein